MGEIQDLSNFQDSDIDLGETIEVKEPYCEFLTGEAGTGKTFELKRRIEEDHSYGLMAATTGIAAVNLNTRTIHSALGYYNTISLQDNFQKGFLQARLRRLAIEDGHRNLVIDECSMMPPSQLQTIYEAIKEVNAQKGMHAVGASLGIILSGDFCQLPPVYESGEVDEGYVFNADCWKEFANNTTRLTKIWRQDNPKFLEAINLLRRGKGAEAAEIMKAFTRFQVNVDPRFDGTTILSTNKEVERANLLRMQQVKGRPVTVYSRRWGKPSSDWKNIPDQLNLKIGCLVMILSNDRSGGAGATTFSYVNGDLGHVVDYTCSETGENYTFQVELQRTGKVVNIGKLHRTNTTKDEPEEIKSGKLKIEDAPTCKPPTDPPIFGRLSLDVERGLWHNGGVEYYPLRVGYAATVFKTQGLSLDRVQVDYRGKWFGHPGSLYVAVSRCRTPEGLRLVGMQDVFSRRCNISPDVEPWL